MYEVKSFKPRVKYTLIQKKILGLLRLNLVQKHILSYTGSIYIVICFNTCTDDFVKVLIYFDGKRNIFLG